MAKREWKPIEGFDFKEILFEEYNHIAKITINRPRYRNAFTPLTVQEMSQAFASVFLYVWLFLQVLVTRPFAREVI